MKVEVLYHFKDSDGIGVHKEVEIEDELSSVEADVVVLLESALGESVQVDSTYVWGETEITVDVTGLLENLKSDIEEMTAEEMILRMRATGLVR